MDVMLNSPQAGEGSGGGSGTAEDTLPSRPFVGPRRTQGDMDRVN